MKIIELQQNEKYINIAMRTIKNKKEDRFISRKEATKVVELLMYWTELRYNDYQRKLIQT